MIQRRSLHRANVDDNDSALAVPNGLNGATRRHAYAYTSSENEKRRRGEREREKENIIHAPPCSSTMRGHDVAGYCDTTEFQDGRVPETRGCREQKEFNFVLRVFCTKGYTACELGVQRAKWAFTRRASEMERGPSEIRAQAEIVCDAVSRPRFTCAHHCAQMLCACIIPRMKSEREQEEATSTWSGRSLPYENRHSLRRHLT
ncbi:hypothetical protein V1478_006713 [Vespula squamosa]|uniref:Uncharacterized protein n=1 Tax=Vespula squamosa TaxID=30214 RepID=A0ABD2B123_VESSQ